MIKFIVSELCGVINSAAEVKKAKDDKEFLSFDVKLTVQDRNGATAEMTLSVSADGGKGESLAYTKGKRVRIIGVIYVKKREGVQYYNLRAEKVDFVSTSEPDKIEGTMEFMGKIDRRGIDKHNDKKGNPYKAFSAFSSEKVADNRFESVWVRFLYFSPKEGEDFLQANAYVKCSGDLRMGVYRDAISLECLLKDVSPWVLDKKNENENKQ